jgi:cyclopropane fatty-acyl-phospholipid synthase-like methyltransferase
MIKEWYKDWFSSKDYLDVYRHRNSEDTERLVNLILSKVALNPNAKVLDAACGAGRHAIKFAEKGFNVTAFDLSKTLLQIGINEARSRNVSIDFQNSDIRTFASNLKFDLVLSLFTSFGYFESDDENFIFPQNAYYMLNNNGYYILDYFNKNYVEENLVEESERKVNQKEILENRFIENDRVIKRISIREENQNNEYVESVKLYSFEQLEERFESIGYNTVNVFGDYLGNPFKNESSEICIIFFQK